MVNTLLFFFKMQFVSLILMYLVPVLFTFYIQGVLKLKKNNSGSKMLISLIISGNSTTKQTSSKLKGLFVTIRSRIFYSCFISCNTNIRLYKAVNMPVL